MAIPGTPPTPETVFAVISDASRLRFGYGFAVRFEESDWGFGGREGECGWGGAASTHFWISRKDGLIAITLRNFMPYEWTLEKELKALIYDAMSD